MRTQIHIKFHLVIQRTITLVLVSLLLLGCTAQPEATPTVPPTTEPILEPTPLPPTLEPTEVPLTPTPLPFGPSYSDVPYIPDGNVEHLLDIYIPEGVEGALPVVMLLHAFGWHKDHHTITGPAEIVVENGYAAVAVEYGVEGEHARFIEDGFCALAWLYENAAEYNLDKEKIVVYGISLGGTITSLLAGVDDRGPFMSSCPYTLPEDYQILGGITYGSPFILNLKNLEMRDLYRDANNLEYTEVQQIFVKLNTVPPEEWPTSDQLSDLERGIAQQLPRYWVNGNEPPLLLMHGANDPWPAQAEEFAQILEASGVEAEFVLIPGGSHRSYPVDVWSEYVLAFLFRLFGN